MAKTLSPAEVELKKRQIVDAATRILEDKGIEGLTVRHLAQRAEVSRQTPFLYFKDKADILNAVRIDTIRRLIDMTRQAVSQSPSSSKIEDLRIKGETYVRFARENPELYKLVTTALPHQDTLPLEARSLLEEYNRMSIEPMQQAWRDGLLALPPDRLNMVFWASIHGLISLQQEGHIQDNETFDLLRADLEFILARGFLPRTDNIGSPLSGREEGECSP